MKTMSQAIRNKAAQATTIDEARRLANIAAYEATLEAEAIELDLEPLTFEEEEEEPKEDNTVQVHTLANGFKAVRNGKGFDVTKDGEFKFYAVRLKAAKDYAKQNKN